MLNIIYNHIQALSRHESLAADMLQRVAGLARIDRTCRDNQSAIIILKSVIRLRNK